MRPARRPKRAAPRAALPTAFALVALAALSAAAKPTPAIAAPAASPGAAAGAAAGPSPAQPTRHYADLLAVDRSGEGFVARQLREARTFPYLDRANRLLAEGRREEARRELEAYLERDPGDLRARYEYGVLLASLGDHAAAEREMTKLLEAKPGFGPALLYRADARQALQEGAAALADYRAAAASPVLAASDRERALRAAAGAAVALGERRQALEALAALDPDAVTPEDELMRATLLAEAGDADAAVATLERVAGSGAAAPVRREALSRAAVLLARQDRLGPARSAAERALALSPDAAGSGRLLRELAEIARRQGDDAAALAYLERAAQLDGSPEVRRAELYAAERAGDLGRATELLRGLLAGEEPGSEQGRRDRVSLASLEARRGRHVAAAELYLETYRARAGRDPDLLVRAAREMAAGGRRGQAIALYQQALGARGLPRAGRAGLAEELANLQIAAGRDAAALDSLRLARELGRDGFRIEQTRGDLLFRAGRYGEALAAYRAASTRRRDPRSLLGAGYALAELGKPGLAVFEIERALAATPPLGQEARRAAQTALGYLYAQLEEHRNAADAWSAVQREDFSPDLAVKLAREERLAGDLDAARDALAPVDGARLAAPERAALLDERAAIARAGAERLATSGLELAAGGRQLPAAADAARDEERRRELAAAAADLAQAIALEPSPEREYRLGLVYVDLDEPERAIPPLERSLASGPFVPGHAATLGYAYQDVGRYRDAGEQLARALDADRDLLPLYEDLGNVRVKEVRNDEAIALFEQAIDNTPLYPVHDAAEAEEVAARRLRMRRQVSELSRRFSLLAYTSICFGSDNCEVGSSPLSAGASKSQGGVELAVRPPVIGYRDGRVFEVISRLLFEQEVDSIEPRGETSVVTLGVRYKPLRAVDGYLSAERLFGVGSQAQDNVLLRGTWGWQHGYAMRPGVPRWWYATLYADVARTMESPQDWFFYAEGRQGVTFNVHADDTTLTPHLYARGRFQTGDGEDFEEVDLGLGVVLRWLFREDRYHDYRSSAELLPRLGYDVYNSDGRDLTVSLTAILRF